MLKNKTLKNCKLTKSGVFFPPKLEGILISHLSNTWGKLKKLGSGVQIRIYLSACYRVSLKLD